MKKAFSVWETGNRETFSQDFSVDDFENTFPPLSLSAGVDRVNLNHKFSSSCNWYFFSVA